MTRFTVEFEPKGMADGHVKEVLKRIEDAFKDVGFWDDGHPRLVNID